MTGALDPWGLPVATAGRSGERAADGLDLPLIARSASGLNTLGLLGGGAGQMRAVAPRADGATPQPFDRAPLPGTGPPAEAMAAWISAGGGQDRAGQLARLARVKTRGDEVLAAAGDEGERTCGREAGAAAWSERG